MNNLPTRAAQWKAAGFNVPDRELCSPSKEYTPIVLTMAVRQRVPTKPLKPDPNCPYRCPECGNKLGLWGGYWACLCRVTGKYKEAGK